MHKKTGNMYNKIVNKKAKLAVVGLGYVGLPIALAFARKVSVIGFDINAERVAKMQMGQDPSQELSPAEFAGCDITFTTSEEELSNASFFIIAVPTPIDKNNKPDLSPLLSASAIAGRALSKGDYVVFESTVFPGCTEDDCIPVLEKASGLESCRDFKVGYSPERINPGDKEHTISRITKIVSGCDDEALPCIADVYRLVVAAGVHCAPTLKVAEAAKIIENTQRDVNIALMNELSIIFNRMGINTYDVLEAAATKWNFLGFYPGLVGGHCIGVDPYYLTFKAEEFGYHAKVINSGRYVNDSMGFYVAKQTVKKIIAAGKNVSKSRVLVMGATFKENVSDIRNSKIADIVNELQSFSVNVEVVDPYASPEELQDEYGFTLIGEPQGPYEAVIVAVNHREYEDLAEDYFKSLLTEGGVLTDVKGIYNKKVKDITYWSL
ncbi:MAG: nucleotide sugar dehydrogenase [Flavobacteriales bacterium]